jgi:hypothetical protein
MVEPRKNTLEPLRRKAQTQSQPAQAVQPKASSQMIKTLSLYNHRISHEAVNEALWGHPDGPAQLRKG